MLDAIARTAARLCEAGDALIYLVDGDQHRLVAKYGRVHQPQRVGDCHPIRPDTPLGQAVIDRRAVHVRDIRADRRGRFSGLRALFPRLRISRVRTLVAMPLLKDAVALGGIVIRRTRVRPFTAKQIALLKTFADQAVIAIENVRLFKELQASNRELTDALDRQTATSEILGVISRSPTDIQPVLDAVAESATRLCSAHDAIIFRLYGDTLQRVAHCGPIPAPAGFAIPASRSRVTGRAVLDGQPIQVTDAQAKSAEFPETEFFAREHGFRTILSVPLLREGIAIGTIDLRRTKVQPFTETQIALLQTFADQAVIAIENVRLFTELEARNKSLTEALDQQTATSEILQVISGTQTDEQPVFDTIVQSAVRLCQATSAAVFRVEGGKVCEPANYGLPPEQLAAARARYPRPLDMETTPGVAILTRSVFQVPDTDEPSVIPHVRDTGRLLGIRSLVAVPLVRENEAVGAIVVTRRERGAFPASQLDLLKTFADQAVIAIENVRLFNETKEALEQQTATSEILRVIGSSPTDAQPVFETIARSGVSVCAALGCAVFVVDGDVLRVAATHGVRPERLVRLREQYPIALTAELDTTQTIRERRVFHLADIERNPGATASDVEYARLAGYRTRLMVPMVHGDRAVGLIVVTRESPQPFPDKQVELLKTFADQAVIAIENVRLFTELQEKNAALTRAHTQVTEALDRQTATADILRVISQAQTEVQPVFEAIADSAMRLFRAWSVGVSRYDGELASLAATRGGLPGSGESLLAAQQAPHRPSHDTLPGRAVLTRAVQHVVDATIDPSWGPEGRRIASDRGFRSAVSVPMLRGREAVGAIVVTRAQPGGFSPTEIGLLQTFGDQAVIAVENARLLAELQARTADLTRSVGQLTALGEVGQAVSSSLDLDTVLTTIVSRAVELSGLDGGVIFEYDEAAEEFAQRAATDPAGALAEARRTARIAKGEGVVGRTAVTLGPAHESDITVAGAYEGRLRAMLISAGVRAVLAVPMLREGHLIGCLAVTRNAAGDFAPETMELLRTFATQSALAIQNARLFREIADKSRQLEVASQHKSEFLANMSHELRTPLNAIIGFSEVLSERMFGELNEKQEEYMKDIHASGQHLLSLINDILDLSKIEAGRMELEIAAFDLPTAIENALTLVRERAGRRGIALHNAVDHRLGQIRGDERKIKQVLLNLLSNALKFTPEGGRVDVRATVSDGMAEVSVTDTGVGIAPEDQEAIFEEFRQVGTVDKKVEGTGLGLTLSRKFIELHGGRIWVQSQVSVGSTFTFTIPMRRVD